MDGFLVRTLNIIGNHYPNWRCSST